MGLRGHWKNVIGPCLRPIGWLGLRAWFPVRWFGVGEPGDHLLIRGFSLAIWLGLDLFFHLVQCFHHRLGVPKTMQVVAFALA